MLLGGPIPGCGVPGCCDTPDPAAWPRAVALEPSNSLQSQVPYRASRDRQMLRWGLKPSIVHWGKLQEYLSIIHACSNSPSQGRVAMTAGVLAGTRGLAKLEQGLLPSRLSVGMAGFCFHC